MFNVLAVGLAGMLGGLFRYALGFIVQEHWVHPFPSGTLLVNFIGCLALGWFTASQLAGKVPASLRVGISTGLIGSFTTFSTFSVETIDLLRLHMWGVALLYIMLSLWGGVILAWFGSKLGGMSNKRESEEQPT